MLSDEKVRELLELKDQMTKKIESHEAEIEFLTSSMDVLDSVLKQSSFTKASSLRAEPRPAERAEVSGTEQPIKGKDGKVIATARITPDRISIVPDGVQLRFETPPFRSFFIERILGGMKSKDEAEVRDGKIREDEVIGFDVNKAGANIGEILVTNYRLQERVREIVDTAGWTMNRMLENLDK